MRQGLRIYKELNRDADMINVKYGVYIAPKPKREIPVNIFHIIRQSGLYLSPVLIAADYLHWESFDLNAVHL